MKSCLRFIYCLLFMIISATVHSQPKKLADVKLSNLDTVTEINSHLLPEQSGAKNLGSSSLLWNNLYLKKFHYQTGTQGSGKVLASNANGEANWYSFLTGSTGSDFSIQFTGNDFIFNLPDASSSNRGLLTAADWNAFNSKQGALNGTGLVKVNGTNITYDNTTYVPANRTLTINGTSYDLSEDRIINVGGLSLSGIGNSPNPNGASLTGNTLNLEPASANFGGVVTTGAQTFGGLKTFSNDIVVNGLVIGRGNNAIASNTIVGELAFQSNNSGAGNSVIGSESMNMNTTGFYNVANGLKTLYNNTDGFYNVAIGAEALYSNNSGNTNTAVGYRSMLNNKSNGNTAMGAQSLLSNTNGYSNSAFGTNTLYFNTTGFQNIGIGSIALNGNTTGNRNTGIGFGALFSNTTGNDNVAVGNYANVASGNLNNATAIGANAFVAASNSLVLGSIQGVNNAGSGTNVGIGTTTPSSRLHVVGAVRIEDGTQGAGKVLTSDANGLASWQPASGGSLTLAAIGTSPNSNGATISGNTLNLEPANASHGGVVTTANQTFAGTKTFDNDVYIKWIRAGIGAGTGFSNTIFGENSLQANTTGSGNTGMGWHTLFQNSTGEYNTANGYGALRDNTTGKLNTASGLQALLKNISGDDNTATGHNALFNNTTGGYNTGFGTFALYTNSTGSLNTAIGVAADVSSGNLSNATAIGSGAVVSSSNSVRIGNTSVTSIGGEVGWSTLSDGRYKTNLKNNVPGLEFINKLKPVTYNLDVQKIHTRISGSRTTGSTNKAVSDPMDNPAMKRAMDEKSKVVYTGFVAQEVAQVAEKMGYDFSGVDKPKNENESFYAIRYAEFVVPLVKAVQELSAENDALKTRLEKIEALLANKNNTTSDKSHAGTVVLSSARLDQNIPNPAGNQTLIKYYIPQNTQQAEIRVTGINGALIKSIRLNAKGEGQVNLNMEYLVNGNYIYSLFVDGQMVDSRKMIVTK